MHGSAPFSKQWQLCNELDVTTESSSDELLVTDAWTLPGQPTIEIKDSAALDRFLVEEFWAQDLEIMAPKLWIMTTPSSRNVRPLHAQKVKGREIVITEDPRLHLIWIHDRIFVKPLPEYLLSYNFWDEHFRDDSTDRTVRSDTRKAALGYIRTYAHLVKHKSDFAIAQQQSLQLVPKHIRWTEFCRFIADVSKIEDIDVSGRYRYGELRLTRLNLYAKILLRKYHYEQIHHQYADYFARLYGPVLFVFAVVSTMLNAAQVEMAAETILNRSSFRTGTFILWTGRACFIFVVLAGFCFAILWLRLFVDEWVYTIKRRAWKAFSKNDSDQW